MQSVSNLITFYRKCYRSDNRDLSIWNVFKIDDAYWPDLELEELATGDFPRIPLPNEKGEVLLKKCELKVRESNLVYAVAFIAGKLTGLSGFSTERDICSPLIYYDAKIEYQNDNYYIKIDLNNPHVNYSLVSAISASENGDSAQDEFPEISTSPDNVVVGNIVNWLNKNSIVDDTLELLRFPKLVNKGAARVLIQKNSGLIALPAAVLLLVDRPKGSRGVLHELKTLESCKSYSAPLRALFSADYSDVEPGKAADRGKNNNIIPGLLSTAQIKALDIAENDVLGLVTGPPGTGKSYTIAAIALDRILQGEHVLVVSETDQALDVINAKLTDDFNVGKAALRTGKKEFLRELKKLVDGWLKTGVVHVAQDEIDKLIKSLQTLQKKIQTAEKKFISRAGQSIVWGHSLAGSGLLDKIKRFYIKWRIESSEPHWKKLNELEILLKERDKKAALYLKKWLNKSIRNLLKYNREELSKFNMAIRARSSKKQLELHGEIDYRTLFGAFPVWLASLDMIHYSLPLKKHLFDLLIIDEATQCDIASVIPALQRAKRVLIVGDSKQLKHVSFISYKNEKKMFQESGPGDLNNDQNYDRYSYKKNSILDLVSNAIKSQDSVVMLDEHYRSKPDLISFSNDKFYSSRLKVMQHRPDEFMTGNIIIKKVEGARNNQGVNRDEAIVVIETLAELISSYTGYAVKPSMGILSPYRDQAIYLQKLLLKHISLSDIEAHAIRVATPYGFQGDEKDYMLISMSVDNDSRRAAAYLNREDMFNVAITRSRQKIYIFSSIDHNKLPINNLFRQYMESIDSEKAVFNADEAKFDGFQHEVCNVLESSGIKTWRSYPVAGRNVDILCRYKTSTLAIDLTGFPGECSEFLELETYYLFSRAGLDIFPLSYGQWTINNELCVSEIKSTLSVS